MKSYKSISAAVLVALSLYPPWPGVPNGNAQTTADEPSDSSGSDPQTNADMQSNSDADGQAAGDAQVDTNLYRARINLVCTSTNANGNLVHDRIITSEFVQECAVAMGITDSSDLALAYNRNNDSLEVVNRVTREVVCTPLSFAVGTALTNANNTRVLLQTFVFLGTDTIASGLLSATQRLAYTRSGELRSFGMRGSIFYSFTDGSNSPTLCQGIVAVGTGISQRGNRNQDLNNNNDNQDQRNDDDDDDNNGNNNQGSTNVIVNPNTSGTGTSTNQGFTSNQGFGTGVNQGFTANQGVGTGVNQGNGITGVNRGFGTGINQGTGLGTGISGVNQGFGTSLNQGTGLGTTVNQGTGTGVNQP
ncbi:MAG TPA: hypothetical protein VFZ59_04890 [Verrucomicrobiae bacterium]|nr:hypothetical protein [Verrucomicrobiae bacterium]